MCLSHLNGQCIPPLSVEHGQRKYVSRVEARFDFASNRGAVHRRQDWVTDAAWEFVISSAFETSARLGLANSSPLLEKERDTAPLALVPKRQDPFFLHRPGAGTTLATDNHPIDTAQIYSAQVFQQRFN